MTTATTTNPEQPVREVRSGTLVVFACEAGTYRYEGPHDGTGFEVAFSCGGQEHGLRCTPADVAPADTPIPARSDRVVVAKQERGRYPTWQGPWLLRVDGQPRGFFKTKREGTTTGLRIVAIREWHAGAVQCGPAVLPHTGITVPHTRITMRKLKTLATDDGEAFTADLLLDGKVVGTVSNSGVGGGTTWFPTDRASFGWDDMAAYADGCRDEDGEPTTQDFVLSTLFEEARTARLVVRNDRAGKATVRTIAVITGGVRRSYFADAYYAVEAAYVDVKPLLAEGLWRQRPNAHAIQVWDNQAWQDLPKPSVAEPATATNGGTRA